MGAPMARVLARAGFDVQAWNRTRAKAEPLAADGVSVCASPRDATANAQVVITMLSDVDAVEAAMSGDDGGLAGAADDAVWLQTSTVGVDGEQRLRQLADRSGIGYVDCPVLGTTQPAEKGQLVALAAGADGWRELITPVLDAIGQRTIWLERPGDGTRLKLVCNSWVLAVTTAVGEAIALAGRLDLDPQLFLEAISGGALDLPYAQLKGGMMLRREFSPAFPVAGAAKDAGLIVAAAERAGAQLAVADAVRRQMDATKEAGHADEDMAAVWHAAYAG
jgi:3-hydroxyisobutyrate dehydrogenase